jgi:hypothetical protein
MLRKRKRGGGISVGWLVDWKKEFSDTYAGRVLCENTRTRESF